MQNKEESGKTDHHYKLGKVGRTTSDDYDHAGPAFIVVKEQQQRKNNAEQCKEHTEVTVRMFLKKHQTTKLAFILNPSIRISCSRNCFK